MASRAVSGDAPSPTSDDRQRTRQDKPQAKRPGERIHLPEAEPWSEPVPGHEVANEVSLAVDRHVALPMEAAVASTLWVLLAHVHDGSRVSPVLAIVSPTKRCGKTTLLSLVGRLVPRPLPSANITTAALFRVIGSARPTLLIDEADTFLRSKDELRGVLNSGHTRDMAHVVRTVGEGANADVRQFPTWGPKAIAAIGELPDTLSDRSVMIRLERRRPDEPVERMRADDPRYERLARQLARWGLDNADAAEGDPLIPPELHDRAADNWQPLLAIAERIGGSWPELARSAARLLSGGEDRDEESAAVVLLGDLHTLFAHESALWTSVILDQLESLEDRPWAEWSRGRPLSPQGLSRLLAPFRIRPRDIRRDNAVRKGYRREQFVETWKRYPPAATPLLAASDAGSTPAEVATNGSGDADRARAVLALRAGSSGVAE